MILPWQNGRISINNADFDAVIFDLDGVVTDTANLHAQAWKSLFDRFLSDHAERNGLPFEPFDEHRDYRLFIDGKPRLDGIRSFLISRRIYLPEGTEEDGPSLETISGMGGLKNEHYKQLLRSQGVTVYQSTVDFVQRLKAIGLKTAVISSSRNCAFILERANLSQLFDIRIDGVETDRLGIPGKPAPDIFLEAARRLVVKPDRAVVVEDAISGVQAGRAGGFKLVIGICRDGNCASLRENGAHVVVRDLADVTLDMAKKVYPLPSALRNFEEIFPPGTGTLAIFLDYDGTLTPITGTPDRAVLPEETRDVLAELAGRCTVAVISGRDLQDVRQLVNLDSIIYAGSHGFEISGPKQLQVDAEIGIKFLPDLEHAAQELSRKTASIPGVLVERKRFSIAIHYRLAPQEEVEMVERVVDEVADSHSKLKKTLGKKVFELRPAIDWHKGKALLSLLDKLNLDRPDVLPIYIGDDVTDEDAFNAVKGRGIGIVVQEEPYETAADYRLLNQEEVRRFLLRLLPFCNGGAKRGR